MSVHVPLNDLARAAQSDLPLILELTRQIVERGWFIQGPHHAHFEDEFARFLGVSHVLGVANGTDALEIALRSVKRGSEDEVVTVANAGGYTSAAAAAAGLKVAYVDIDPQTQLVDVGLLGGALTSQTVAVVVTHLYGRVVDVDAVLAVCRPRGIAVIEDCAQAHGARTEDGRRAGALGDLATFSFYPTKNLGGLGDGGAVATSDEGTAAKVRQLRQYGWAEKYRVMIPGGRNSRLDELQAAFLTHRLKSLDVRNARRRDIIRAYAAAAPSGVRVLPADGEGHAAHLAVVLCEERGGLRAHLGKAGISTEVHYPVPDHKQPAWDKPGLSLPHTEKSSSSVLSLPCFPEMTNAEVATVASSLIQYGA